MKKIDQVTTGSIKDIRFDANGLIPAIIQDYKTKDVLMLAYMNKRSLNMTLKYKKACFWSRSRGKYWIKGETSGCFQIVKQVCYDCDGDTLLIKVRQLGIGACHNRKWSCFYRSIKK